MRGGREEVLRNRRDYRWRGGSWRGPVPRMVARSQSRPALLGMPRTLHYAGLVANVLSVNLARVRANPDAPSRSTGIDKAAVDEAVMVRPPGPMRGGLGSGLVGDTIGNQKLHGGDDQAVYAYAREDLDGWETQLARSLTNGMFGENLTTAGVDVTGARIGERWRIGTDGLVLEVSRAPYSLPHLFGLPATGQLDQDLHRCGETRSLSSGCLTGNGALRGHDLDRLPPRSRRDDRRRISRPDVRTGPASAVA